MPSTESTRIFKTASTTYFTSSLFFPAAIKERIFTLYAFVRLVDDYADTIPQDPAGFYKFRDAYYDCVATGGVNATPELSGEVQDVITNFVQLQQLVGFKQAWVDAFLKAMELDLYKSHYHTLRELKSYMYGSAEVIGLMICACIGVVEKAHPTARLLGRAMQYANFLRDIAEDIGLGRQYIPDEVLKIYGLPELSQTAALENPVRFARFFAGERRRYEQWNAAAKLGFIFLPPRTRIPVAAATEMYSWSIQTIAHDPLIVFERKVKPSKERVIRAVADHWFMDWVE